jgi:hypothetical protein
MRSFGWLLNADILVRALDRAEQQHRRQVQRAVGAIQVEVEILRHLGPVDHDVQRNRARRNRVSRLERRVRGDGALEGAHILDHAVVVGLQVGAGADRAHRGERVDQARAHGVALVVGQAGRGAFVRHRGVLQHVAHFRRRQVTAELLHRGLLHQRDEAGDVRRGHRGAAGEGVADVVRRQDRVIRVRAGGVGGVGGEAGARAPRRDMPGVLTVGRSSEWPERSGANRGPTWCWRRPRSTRVDALKMLIGR